MCCLDGGTLKVSVITASLNRRDFLRRAINSVREQKDVDFIEHIVVDGCSTDGTVELLQEYQNSLVVLREPDKNVYEAWNKGVCLATGDIICFLNSDDTLPPDAIMHVRQLFALNPDADMVSGCVSLDAYPGGNYRIIDYHPTVSLREQDIGPGIPITNGRFIRRSFLNGVGPFDDSFKLVSDRDWLLRALLAGVKNISTEQVLYNYTEHSESLTFSGPKSTFRLAEESLSCASKRLLITDHTRDKKNAYRRWHAWALFYLIFLNLRSNKFKRALSIAISGTRQDPTWCFRLPSPLLRHYMERSSRRGKQGKS